MKRTSKSLLLIAIITMILLTLTGCGKNKLVATKSSDDYEEKIEISFKDDKIKEVTWTMEFDKEEDAESFVKLFESMSSELEGAEVKQKGKKAILKFDEKSFAEFSGDEANSSKEDIKKALEEDGYKVK